MKKSIKPLFVTLPLRDTLLLDCLCDFRGLYINIEENANN
jgi:hypothetical protein